MSAAPETASFREFAALARFKPSYITQLKADERLVLTAAGKRVRVAESLARIAATRDPGKAAVSARHAAARNSRAGEDMPPRPDAAAPPDGDDSDGDGDGAESARGGLGYQHARAVKEHYQAQQAKLDYERATAKLLDAGAVEAAVADAITVLRTRLESLPDVLGPQLAPITDEAQCRATLAEAIEHALEETSRQFANLAKGVT